MGRISIIVTTLVVPFLVRFLLGALNKDKKQTDNKVGASRGIFAAGWGFLGLTALLLTLELIFKKGILMWVGIIFSGIFALMFLIISYELEIYYDKNGFTARKFFLKRQYCYEDIDSVLMGSGGSFTFNIKGKKLHVDNMMSGRREFFKFAKKQHFARQGYSIKEVRHKLFNGHILEPYSFLVTQILFLLLVTSYVIWIIVLSKPEYPEKLIELEPCTISVEEAGKHTASTLSVPEGKISMFNTPASAEVLEDISQRKRVKMYIEPWQESSDGPYTRVWKMEDENGKLYFSEEDTFAGFRKDSTYTTIIFTAIAAISWAVVLFGWHVMSNPVKYPKYIKCIVREDHIIW